MKILVVCYYGKNRSKYLAGFLQGEGYDVRYGGVADDAKNKLSQDDVDWASHIIFVEERIRNSFLKRYKLGDQSVITLEVEDRPEIITPDIVIKSAEDWLKVQNNLVYPELKKQLEKYLPFE